MLCFRAPQNKIEAVFQMPFGAYRVTYRILALKTLAVDIPVLLKNLWF